MIGIVCPRDGDIVQYLRARKSISLGDGNDTLRAEGTFSIDKHTLAFAPAHINR